MAFTNSWNEGSPLGSDAASSLDDVSRQLKLDMRERFAVEHYMLATDDADKTGRHMFERGTLAGRPAAAVRPTGAPYWDTDDNQLWMNDGAAWVLVGVSKISEATDAGGDPLPVYLLTDGSRTLTGDLAVAATKLVDGVDISLHAHTGAAGHGPQLTVAALAANAITQARFATNATHTTANVANVWEDAGVQITFTPSDAANQILIVVLGVAGNNRAFDLGIQRNVEGEVAITGPFLSSSGTGGTGCGLLYMNTFTAVASEFDLRIRPTTNNAVVVNTLEMLILELKR